jgi:hypothetical protein
MERRELLMLAACEAPHAPVDEGRLNAFAPTTKSPPG